MIIVKEKGKPKVQVILKGKEQRKSQPLKKRGSKYA